MSKNSLNLEIPGIGTTLSASLGTTVVAPAAPVEPARPVRVAKQADKRGWWWGTGRRKTAVCRVRMKPAEGSKAVITVEANGKDARPIEIYFPEQRDRTDSIAALVLTSTVGRFQIVAKCHGGGTMGQAQAMRLAIARALVNFDPNLYVPLREAGFMTRDAREVERKKYGQPGARRRFQFSKR